MMDGHDDPTQHAICEIIISSRFADISSQSINQKNNFITAWNEFFILNVRASVRYARVHSVYHIAKRKRKKIRSVLIVCYNSRRSLAGMGFFVIPFRSD